MSSLLCERKAKTTIMDKMNSYYQAFHLLKIKIIVDFRTIEGKVKIYILPIKENLSFLSRISFICKMFAVQDMLRIQKPLKFHLQSIPCLKVAVSPYSRIVLVLLHIKTMEDE